MSPAPRSPDRVAAVVLAAGESRRFGSPKQLALLGERTLLEHVLALADNAGLDPIAAVVPVWLSRPASAASRLRWIRNPHPGRGISFSLKLGFAAVHQDADAAVVLLADQPTLPISSIAALVAGRGERPIVAGWSGEHPAPPVLIERSHFGIVEDATGDRGLRDLLLAHPEWVAAVELPAAADVDTPAQLNALGPQH